MPADVCELDRAIAQRAVWRGFEHHVVYMIRHGLRCGERFVLFAPCNEEIDAVAVVIAEFREEYLSPGVARARAAQTADPDFLPETPSETTPA